MIARPPTHEFESISDTKAPLLITIDNEKLDKARALIPGLETITAALLGHGIDQGKELFNVLINLEKIIEDKAAFNRFSVVLLRLSTAIQTKKIIFGAHETSLVNLCNELLIDISKI